MATTATRQEAAVRLKALRQALREALSAKKTRMRDLAARCKSERAALRKLIRDARARALAEARADMRAARAAAKAARAERVARARSEAPSPVAHAKTVAHAEREHARAHKRITDAHQATRSEIDKSHTRLLEASASSAPMLQKLGPLLEKAGKIQPAPGESRVEALWRHAESRPEEMHALLEPRAERDIAQTRAAIAAAEQALWLGPVSARKSGRAPKSRSSTTPKKGKGTVEPPVDAGPPVSPLRPPNEYELKKAARIERMRSRAGKLRATAEGAHARARAISDRIPFGQPILVGHHSEKRHRRDLARIQAGFRKAVEFQSEAQALERRATYAETNAAVSSDDPDAVPKLREKLAAAKREHERLLEANRRIRAGGRDAEVLQVLGWPADRQRTLDIWRSLGHRTLPTTNSSANIRRIEARIRELEKRASSPARPAETFGEARIVEADNRVKVSFPSVPPPQTRQALKSAGFRWSPTASAWQRFASPGAWVEARRIVGEYAAPRAPQ